MNSGFFSSFTFSSISSSVQTSICSLDTRSTTLPFLLQTSRATERLAVNALQRGVAHQLHATHHYTSRHAHTHHARRRRTAAPAQTARPSAPRSPRTRHTRWATRDSATRQSQPPPPRSCSRCPSRGCTPRSPPPSPAPVATRSAVPRRCPCRAWGAPPPKRCCAR